MRLEAIIVRFPGLEAVELAAWIERGWVRPEPAGPGDWVFQEIDIARIQLIFDIRRDLGVAEDTAPLVLSLIDQVYDLRAALKALSRALEGQPAEVRSAVLAALAERKDA
jgi:chaperone modulatory protein CbpM